MLSDGPEGRRGSDRGTDESVLENRCQWRPAPLGQRARADAFCEPVSDGEAHVRVAALRERATKSEPDVVVRYEYRDWSEPVDRLELRGTFVEPADGRGPGPHAACAKRHSWGEGRTGIATEYPS